MIKPMNKWNGQNRKSKKKHAILTQMGASSIKARDFTAIAKPTTK